MDLGHLMLYSTIFQQVLEHIFEPYQISTYINVRHFCMEFVQDPFMPFPCLI